MSSLFSKIVNGEIPCYKIAETENCLAFLDIFPLQKGHTLVISKKEADPFYTLEDDILQELMLLSKKLSIAISKTFPCERVALMILGMEVPHTHFHLIPINTENDCNFAQKKLIFSQEEMTKIAQDIKQHLNA